MVPLHRAELLLPGAEFDIKDSSGTVIEHVVTGQDNEYYVSSGREGDLHCC